MEASQFHGFYSLAGEGQTPFRIVKPFSSRSVIKPSFASAYLMPTYDYECDACSHTFELFQGINDPVQKKCPECKKNKLRRLFGTGAAIMFKGSGFYQTDYRSEGYKKAAKADKPASDSPSGDKKAKPEAAQSTAKSDKPAKKADA
jgi:putative FmdB family regulatory protein